ncbi:MAG: pectate lyase, partial [Verrucomicrobiota bacterium]
MNPARKYFEVALLCVSCVLFVLSGQSQTAPIDFSTAGYAANEKPIPTAPIRVVVAPQSGDSTARIQNAIDHVSSLPLDTNGLRGAVLLSKGRHEVLGGLSITNSGVILRGQGVNDTTLVAAGLDRRTLIRVSGKSKATTGPSTPISADVPVGATTLRVQDASAFKPGNQVRITRPSTKEWIVKLGAMEFGGGEGGGWKPGSRDITWDRIVKAVDGDVITLDAPITTAIDTAFGGGTVALLDWPDRIINVGIENLALESTFDATNPKDENHSWCAITMENTADAWVRQVTFKHFAGSAVALYETCQRITVQDCVSLAPVSEIGGYRRHTFFTMGQQTLFLRCYAESGRHDFSVGHCAAGPNAFVQCEAREALDDSAPIESWASGLLYDN